MTSFSSQMGSLLFLVWIFFINFISRIILSPLIPVMEESLKIGHGEAGSLFLLLSVGYCIMLFGSGFVSSRLTHRRTIALSALGIAAGLFVAALSPSLWGIKLGFVAIGIGAGLYLPSGLAILSDLVESKDLGKAIAIHELAPNLSYVVSPFLANLLLRWGSWRWVLGVVATTSFVTAVLFFLFGRGGTSRGKALNIDMLRSIGKESSLWGMILLFCLGIGASLGIYSILPIYLVASAGVERSWANTLVGLSRVLGLGATVLSGWLTDELGPQRALKIVFIASGIGTVLLGFAGEGWMTPIIFVQPLLASAFFVPGLAALSKIGSPEFRKVAVSLTVPFGFLLGGGMVPAGIGLFGDAGSFSLGIILFGGLTLAGSLLVRFLKVSEP